MDGISGAVSSQAGLLEALSARLAAADAGAAEQRQRLAQLEKTLATMQPRLPPPEAQLKALLARSTLYFAQDTTLANPPEALAALDEIAAMTKETGAALRVDRKSTRLNSSHG